MFCDIGIKNLDELSKITNLEANTKKLEELKAKEQTSGLERWRGKAALEAAEDADKELEKFKKAKKNTNPKRTR